MDITEGHANNEIVRHIRTTSSISRSAAFYNQERIEQLAKIERHAPRLHLKILSSSLEKGTVLTLNA